MNKVKISYQGIPGAYSHLACYTYFGENIDCLENNTFEEAMEQVENGISDYAIIPIENKTAGRVAEFYGLIPQMRLYIVGEHYQRIEHCLIGLSDSELEHIQDAHSHPQALAQCRKTLKRLKIKQVASFDTAGAVKDIKDKGDKYVAAIASSWAAKIYGLKILKSNIQDYQDNFTRFIILSKDENQKDNNINNMKPNMEYITSIIFELKNIPSALYNAIGGFAKNNVNILKIESYIPLGKPINTYFHIDVATNSTQYDRVFEGINELKSFVENSKILGTYERKEFGF